MATPTGQTKSWLIDEALRSYVANEQQFLAAVEEGKQGRVIDHATVVSALTGLSHRAHVAAAVDGTRQHRFSRDRKMAQGEKSSCRRSRVTAYSR